MFILILYVNIYRSMISEPFRYSHTFPLNLKTPTVTQFVWAPCGWNGIWKFETVNLIRFSRPFKQPKKLLLWKDTVNGQRKKKEGMIVNGWTVLKAKAADDSQRLKNHEWANWTLLGRTAQKTKNGFLRIFIKNRFETANVCVVCQL